MLIIEWLSHGMAWIGLVNPYQPDQHYIKYILSTTLYYIYHIANTVYLASHLFNTVTRAIRYTPEFFQKLLEDFIVSGTYVQIMLYLKCYPQVKALVKQIGDEFNADLEVSRNCDRRATLTLIAFSLAVGIALVGSLLETLLPTSEQDLAILSHVYYRTHNPKRIVPFMIRIPFVDITKEGTYQIVFAWEMFTLVTLWSALTVTYPLIPIMVIHVQGQYDILSKYIKQLGREHRNSMGQRICYTNLEKNQSQEIDEHKQQLGHPRDNRKARTNQCEDNNERNVEHAYTGENHKQFSKMDEMNKKNPRRTDIKLNAIHERHMGGRKRKDQPSGECSHSCNTSSMVGNCPDNNYEDFYFRQIVRYHQKLLRFQTELENLYSATVLILLTISNIALILSLIQLTLNLAILSPLRVTKFLAELTAILLQYYYACNCSEVLDNCSVQLRVAVANCRYDTMSPATRRGLCMLLRRIQRPNHFRFFQGGLVLSRRFFLSVMNWAYTLVNFLRLRI